MFGVWGCLHYMAQIFKGSGLSLKQFFDGPNLCYNVLFTCSKNLPILILLMVGSRKQSQFILFSLWFMVVCISALSNGYFPPVVFFIKVCCLVNFSYAHYSNFLYRWLGIQGTKNPKELQSFWACQMKSRQKRSLRTFLSKARSVSSHVTNLTAITWTC